MGDEDDLTRRAFRIVGVVQGVGFRWWTARLAERLGVAGSVRNLPDGSVEVQAVGREEQLAELEAALRNGPRGARVDRVDALEPDPAVPPRGFRIDR